LIDPVDGAHSPPNLIYTEEGRKKLRENLKYFLEYRKAVKSTLNRSIDIFVRDSPRLAAT